MATIGALLVELSANTAAFQADMGKAQRILASSSASMNRTLSGIEKSFSVLTGAARTFAGALGLAFGAAAAKQQLDLAGGLGELAVQLGVTTDALQTYQFMASQSGVKAQELEAGISRLTRTIGDAAEGQDEAVGAFNRLGVGVLDAGGKLRSTEAILRDVADRVQKIEDPASRAAIVVDLFGRSGQRLLPILEGGAAGFDQWTAKLKEMGLILDETAIRQADAASDSIAALETAFSKLAQTAISKVAPALTKLAEAWTWILGGMPGAAESFVAELSRINEEITKREDIIERGIGSRRYLANIEQEINGLYEERSRLLATMPAPPAAAAPEGGPTRNPESDRDAEARRREIDAEFKMLDDRAKELQKTYDDLGNRALRVWEDTATPLEKHLAYVDELDELLRQNIIDWELYERAVGKSVEGLEAAETQTRKTNDVARDLGLTFSSAFEDAIVKGESFRDVLVGIITDIQRLLIRKSITEPVTDWLGGVFSSGGGLFGGGGGSAGIVEGEFDFMKGIFDFGGFFAEGGRPPMGKASIVGENGPELFVPDSAGSIVPNGALAAGPTVYIDARGADSAGLARVERAVRDLNGTLERRAVSAVVSERRRNPNLFTA